MTSIPEALNGKQHVKWVITLKIEMKEKLDRKTCSKSEQCVRGFIERGLININNNKIML